MRGMSNKNTSERKERLTPDPVAYGCSHALSGKSYKAAARTVGFDVKATGVKSGRVNSEVLRQFQFKGHVC